MWPSYEFPINQFMHYNMSYQTMTLDVFKYKTWSDLDNLLSRKYFSKRNADL